MAAPVISTRLVGGHELGTLSEGWEACRTAAVHPQMVHRIELVRGWTAGEVQAVAAEVDGGLVGMAVLARARRPHTWQVRRRSSRSAVATFRLDTVDVLGEGFAAADDPAVTSALFRGVLDASCDADLVRFHNVRDGSSLAEMVRRPVIPGGRWLCVDDRFAGMRYRTRLDVDLRSYLARHLTPSSRHYLERDVRRVQRLPDGCRVEVFTAPSDVAGLLEQVDAIEARTWHARRQARLLGQRTATRDRLEAWAALGLVRGYTLAIGAQPVAFVLAYASDECLWVAKMGYDDAWSRRSPGKVLLWHVLDDLHRDGTFTAIDLGPGHWGFKSQFAPGGYPVRSASIVRIRPRPVVATVPGLLWGRARGEAQRSLARSGALGDRTQSWVRRNLAR